MFTDFKQLTSNPWMQKNNLVFLNSLTLSFSLVALKGDPG